MTSSNTQTNLRIILAITTKDLVEALKNKNSAANIVMVILMIAFYRYLPELTARGVPASMLVYDPGKSAAITNLDRGDQVRIYRCDSPQMITVGLAEGDDREIGLVLPIDMDQRAASGEPVILGGHMVSWASTDRASEVVAGAEQLLSQAAGSEIEIQLAETRVFPALDSGGPTYTMSVAFIFALAIMGVGVAPHLMIEEKATKTLEALLVSPARTLHITAGKALTALFYSLVTSLVVVAFFPSMIIRWEFLALGVVLGALFFTALGLLLGIALDARQQLSLWGMVILTVLLVPSYFPAMAELFPDVVNTIVRCIPSVGLGRILRASAVGSLAGVSIAGDAILVTIVTAALLVLVARLISRRDR